MLPLYAKIRENAVLESKSAHVGLLFDKFADSWNKNFLDEDEGGNLVKIDNSQIKKKFLNNIIEKYKDSKDCIKKNLENSLKRQISLLEQFGEFQYKILEVTTDWRFVSGLGASHPFETGFIWHRTLGVPYLPGSSVKGLMRAWAEQWGGLDDQEAINRLFGSAEGVEGHCGELIVFDALPCDPPKLEVDILNPHYSEYYQNAEKPPADYLSPVPVFFLTVAPGMAFKFILALRPGGTDQKLLNEGFRLLTDALENLGAGAKTAVGYGLFAESADAKKNRINAEEMRELETRNQEAEQQQQAEIDEVCQLRGYVELAKEVFEASIKQKWVEKDNSEEFYRAMNEDYLKKIENETNLQIKNDAINIICEILETRDPRIMTDPNRTKGKKPAYKPQPIKIAIWLKSIKE